jgi:hypothetical protein
MAATATTKVRSKSSSSWVVTRCGSSIGRALIRTRIRILVLAAGKVLLLSVHESVLGIDRAASRSVTPGLRIVGRRLSADLSQAAALCCLSC